MRPSDIRVAITDRGADRHEVLSRARDLYDDDVRVMDLQVDRLLRRLESESGAFETHIVIAADHGENFGETGSLGHGRRLTGMDLHVPLVILSPDVEAGVRQEAVGMIDLPATLLDLAGAPTDLGSSRSLLEAGPRRQVLGMQRPFIEPFREIRLDGSVHVLEGLRFFSVIDDRLYLGNSEEVVLDDLSPGEPEAERVAELREQFRGFEDQMADPDLSLVDEEVLEQMRALGYVQ
jgi:arylsulfatase A-like enzyme